MPLGWLAYSPRDCWDIEPSSAILAVVAMIRLNDILDRVAEYSKDADLDVINKAYVYSAKVHTGQKRASGEPYLTHPMEVAGILVEMKMDVPSIATGMLHDTIEDTLATYDEISQIFGPEIADLVEGVTKLSKVKFKSKEARQAENFRKMLMAMAQDIRVILVKLADRLHNMRTLEHLKEEKQKKIRLLSSQKAKEDSSILEF